MKILFALTCVAAQIVQASPTIESVLQANKSTTKRYGHMDGASAHCVLYADPSNTNYQYILAGGFIDISPVAWSATYGPAGNLDNPLWSIDPTTVTFAGYDSKQENYVKFYFDPHTLKITRFTENFPEFNVAKRDCTLDN